MGAITTVSSSPGLDSVPSRPSASERGPSEPLVAPTPLKVPVYVNESSTSFSALVDSGSQADVVSPDLIHKRGLDVRRLIAPLHADLAADGKQARLSLYTRATVRVGELVSTRSFFVLPLPPNLEMILGVPWMTDTKTGISSNALFVVPDGPSEDIFDFRTNRFVDQPQQNLVDLGFTDRSMNDKEFSQFLSCALSAGVPRDEVMGAVETIGLEPHNPLLDIEEDDPSMGDLSSEEALRELDELLSSFADVFVDELPGPPPFRPVNHSIQLLDDERKIRPHAIRIPDRFKAQWTSHLRKFVETGFWSPAALDSACSMFAVPKHDKSQARFVINLKPRNENTIRVATPLPDMKDVRNRFASHKFRSKIDFKAAYEQVRLTPESVPLSGFVTPNGTFVSHVMQQGDANAPETMSRVCYMMFSKAIGRFLDCFYDDVLVYSHTRRAHLRYLAIWMSDHIERLNEIASPLTHLTGKVNWNWTEACQYSFDLLRSLVPNTLVPLNLSALQDGSERLFLFTDASMFGCGGWLGQGKTRCRKMHEHLVGWPFVVVCDHEPLRTYWSQPTKQTRRHETNEPSPSHDDDIPFPVELVATNRMALACLGSFSTPPVASTWVRSFHLSALSLEPATPQLTSPLPESLLADIRAALLVDTIGKKVLANPPSFPSFAVVDNLLWLSGPEGWRLVVPSGLFSSSPSAPHPSLREWVIEHAHRTSGHMGPAKTLAVIRRSFWWSSIHADVYSYVRSCEPCARGKSTTTSPFGLLHPLSTPSRPFEKIGMDFVVGLPPIPFGGKSINSILSVTCYLSKLVILVPLPSTATASEVAKAFVASVFRRFGLPNSIVSDRDPKFTSAFWRSLHDRLGIKLKMSTSAHPQTDGQAESTNKTIGQTLRILCEDDSEAWLDAVPHVEFAINTTPSSSTSLPPFSISPSSELPSSVIIPADIVSVSIPPASPPPSPSVDAPTTPIARRSAPDAPWANRDFTRRLPDPPAPPIFEREVAPPPESPDPLDCLTDPFASTLAEVDALVASAGTELEAAEDNFALPSSDPRNHREAMQDSVGVRWRSGEDDDFTSLRDEYKVFHSVDRDQLPSNAKVIGCRFVFRRKKDQHGRVSGHKFVLIRVLLALAARNNLLVHQADVHKAYLHGALDQEIYMRVPGGIDGYDGKVLKLDRALYGLKQVGRNQGGEHHYIALCVNNLLIVSKSIEEITRCKDGRQEEYGKSRT
ncbi:hypothetical protein JCM16303_007255 [Sporobolomyces ruberrimus]